MAKTSKLIFATLAICALLMAPLVMAIQSLDKNETSSVQLDEAILADLPASAESLQVTVKGSGFDRDTRFSFYPDYSNRGAIIGSASTWGPANALVIRGSTAFVAVGRQGLQSFDISNPSNLRPLGAASLSGDNSSAWDLSLVGDIAYVTAVKGGLQLFDIKDPTQIIPLNAVPLPGPTLGIATTPTLAIVASGREGLHFFDIHNSRSPRLFAKLDLPGHAYDVLINDHIAYVADTRNFLHVVDITNPANPILHHSVETPGKCFDLDYADGKIFVAGHRSGLHIFDVSDPVDPKWLSSTDTGESALGVSILGHQAFVCVGGNGLNIYDVTNARRPHLKGTLETMGTARQMHLVGRSAIVANGDEGIKVLDIEIINTPLVDVYPIRDRLVRTVTAQRDYLFFSSEKNILEVWPQGSHAPFESIGHLAYEGKPVITITDLVYQDSLIFAADPSYGIHIYDVTNPRVLRKIGGLLTTGKAQSLALTGNTLCVADAAGGLLLVDVTTPQAPVLMTPPLILGTATAVAARHGLAVVGVGDDGLRLLDISNPLLPKVIAGMDIPGNIRDLILTDKYLFVTAESGGFHIINIVQPHRPQHLATLKTPGAAMKMDLFENTIFLACGTAGLQIIDVNNPATPSLLRSIPTDFKGQALSVAVVWPTIYVAGESLKINDHLLALKLNSRFEEISRQVIPAYSRYSTCLASNETNLFLGDLAGGGIQSFDIKEENPWDLLFSQSYAKFSERIVVKNDLAYLFYLKGGILMVDFSKPEHMQVIGKFPLSLDGPVDLTVEGDWLYLVDRKKGLLILDVLDSDKIRVVSTLPTPGQASGIVIRDDHAFIADSSEGLLIVDVSDRMRPRIVSSVKLPWPRREFTFAWSVALEGSFAYVANGPEGMMVVDISRLEKPRIVSTFNTKGFSRWVFVKNQRAYLGDSKVGVHVLDVSDPHNPVSTGTIVLPSNPSSGVIHQDEGFFADRVTGLTKVQLPASPLKTRIIDQHTAKLTFSHPRKEGRYTLRAYNRGSYSELHGTITLEVPTAARPAAPPPSSP